MKRRIAMLIVAGIVLGGGAFAWAESGVSRPSVDSGAANDASVGLAALADTTAATGSAQNQTPGALRQALQQCRQQAGIAQPQPGAPKTPPTAAQRQAVLDCLAKAGFNPKARRGLGGGFGRAGAAGYLGRAVHGELIVPDGNGGFRTVVYDRGTQSGPVNGDTLTITRPDKATVSVQLTDTTRYAGAQDRSQLHPGRTTIVVADKDGKALLVAQPNRTKAKASGQVTS